MRAASTRCVSRPLSLCPAVFLWYPRPVDRYAEPGRGQVRGQHYDLVLNGVEIGGGSVRVHDADMQEHIFSQILQVRKPQLKKMRHAVVDGYRNRSSMNPRKLLSNTFFTP